MKKFESGGYQKPSRSGISYMIARLMRSYPAPNATEVTTMSLPHYMFYAPNLKDADIGGKPGSQYPFLLPQGPSPHDVIILLVGEAEKATIVSQSKALLDELWSYRKYLCWTCQLTATGRGDWKRLPAFVRRYYLRAEVAQGLRLC